MLFFLVLSLFGGVRIHESHLSTAQPWGAGSVLPLSCNIKQSWPRQSYCFQALEIPHSWEAWKLVVFCQNKIQLFKRFAFGYKIFFYYVRHINPFSIFMFAA